MQKYLYDAKNQCSDWESGKGGFSLVQKQFTTHRAFFLHAAWLDHPCGHCPIFLTAASRRSRIRVSVSVWGVVLSDPLLIVALVSRYLTNKLIRRILIFNRRSFQITQMPGQLLWVLISLSKGYPPVKGRLYTCYAPVRRSPAVLLPRCPSTCMY